MTYTESSLLPTPPPPDSKSEYVQGMFNNIAKTYDLLNNCISLGMHWQWKRAACSALQLKPGGSVLDICTGTGDLLLVLSRMTSHFDPQAHFVGLDFSEGMLQVAENRLKDVPHGQMIQWVQGDAMALPFEAEQFDGTMVGFGLRNVNYPQQALNEMFRVIKPGGRAICLETSPEPTLPGYWLYFRIVMPIIGWLFSRDPKAYRYLYESTRDFLTPTELTHAFETAGFTNVTALPLAFGSAYLHVGVKPLNAA